MMKPTELYACLHIKEFPAQALLRLRPAARNQPCAVLQGTPPFETVVACNAKARALGVVYGMTRVEVSITPWIVLLSRSDAEEAAARLVLLECAGGFTPRIEDQSSDGRFLCVLDISGTSFLFESPSALSKKILESTKQLGFVACIAVSSNFHAAMCLARGMTLSNQAIVVPKGEEASAVATLPLKVLDLPAQHAETFALWGINTLGMLAALPEASLIARIGQEGKRLRQLSRGERQHLFSPLEPVFTLDEQLELESRVAVLDSLLLVIRVMLKQLIMRASARMLTLAVLTLNLSLDNGVIQTRTITPALPGNDWQFWIKLVHLDLEAHPPGAAILAITLAAKPGTKSKVQLGVFTLQLPEPTSLDVTLARIRLIVGEQCVGRPVLKDTHGLDGYHMEPFTLPTNKPSQAVGGQARTVMRLVDTAEDISVGLQDGRPQRFFFKEKRYVVVHAYGPWFVSGEWWSQDDWNYEQWDVTALSGESMLCCCILRDPKQRSWRMVGLYD